MKKSRSLMTLAVVVAGLLAAQPQPARKAAATVNKKPVFGAACHLCPWGALGDVVKRAMQNYGYDVQICHNCNAEDSPRIVAEARMPPPYKVDPNVSVESAPPNDPGLGRVEFGATGGQFLCDAYHGAGRYAKDKPMTNLRLIANIQGPPNYLIVAAKAGLDITDLSQVKAKKWPPRIFGARNAKLVDEVLGYYGLSTAQINEAGGFVGGSGPDPSTAPDPKSYDLIISSGGWVSTMPETRTWTDVIQKNSWNFLTLPDALLDKIAKDFNGEREIVPFGWLPGIDRAIPSVSITGVGTAVYARTDFPDTLAYDTAKALDERQDLLLRTNQRFFYDVHKVCKICDVPLHPGAARYYKQSGYLK
jgi:TRAP-type uncharacterized transport system substrate-binding protein